MEHCVVNGLPFWGIDPDSEWHPKKSEAQSNGNEKLAEKIINKIVAEKRAKLNLADDILNLSQGLHAIIGKI